MSWFKYTDFISSSLPFLFFPLLFMKKFNIFSYQVESFHPHYSKKRRMPKRPPSQLINKLIYTVCFLRITIKATVPITSSAKAI